MKIGVDIDGVLIDCDRYILDNLSKFLYENNLPVMDKPDAFEEKFDLSESDAWKFREEFWVKYFEVAKPHAYAKEVLEILRKKGHEVIIVTARFWKLRNSNPEFYEKRKNTTLKWLKKNKIPYDEICFVDAPKAPAIQSKQIDLMLEDSLENIPELVKVTKVACFNAPYNQGFKHKNMIRVYSWYDFLAKFEKEI